jgi:hypothetical protein
MFKAKLVAPAALVPVTALLLFPAWVSAQSELAALAGTVRDGQGNVVPGALVEARQRETSLLRATRTGISGVFVISSLPVGTYSLEISQSGFAKGVVEPIRLSTGETLSVNVNLRIAERSDNVEVVAAPSEIEENSAATGGRFEGRQLSGLPLNGRNWASLLSQTSGAVDPGTADQRSVRFAGHGRDDNNFELDGVDAGGISNQPQKSGIRLAVPTSAIQEFRVDSSLFNAEAGTGTGGQVALVSASGSNQIHGQAFEFLRNNVFDARNPFSTQEQPFRLNQFGATAGAPIKKDQTFVFVAFEGLRQRLDQPLQGFVPSASYRAQAIAQSPALAPLMNAYPTGTTPQASDPTTDLFSGLSPQRVDETSGMVRFDQHINDRTTAFLRFNADESVSDVPLGNLKDRQVVDNRPLNGALGLTKIISPAVLNDIRVGFNQVFSRTSNITALPYSLKVAGFTTLSSWRTREEDDTSWALIDNLSVTRGRHFLKFGVQVRRVFTNPASSADGTLTYTNANTFAGNQLDSAAVTGVMPLKRLRKTQVYAFAQDEFKLTGTITLNVGLRYEFFNVFHEADGRAMPFDFATCGGFCAAGAEFSAPRTNDFDPRVGIAWAPASLRGRTVLRAGFGIYHGDGQLEDQNLPASNDVPRYSLSSKQIPGLTYPIAPFLITAPGILSPRAQNRNREDEYASQWGATLQQELPAHLIGTVSYLGNKGTNLQTITAANLIDPVTGLRPYPSYGQVEYRTNDSNSTFHALLVSARRSFRSGLIFSANYMWSHAINDGSLGGGEADIMTPENPFCRACDRASSAQDIRHYFTANTVYDLPFGKGRAYLSQPGPLGTIFGGWAVAAMATARTGRPVNVTISRSASAVPGGYTQTQRPDLVLGVPLTPESQSPAGWFNPAAFRAPASGTFGNAGRSLLRGPAFSQLDMSLARRVTLHERAALEMRWEVFNVFNRAQLGDPIGDVTVPAQFGVIQSTINTTPIGTGTPRQMQFMLRFSF